MLDKDDDAQEAIGTAPAKEIEGQANGVKPPADEDVDPWWRGVFAPEIERTVLFTKEFDVDDPKLPRWEPHIHIEPLTEGDDDE